MNRNDPRTADILSALPGNTIWDLEPVAFIPDQPTACMTSTATTATVADLTGTKALAARAELDEYQRTMCAACPALIDCAAHALVNEPYGTWGLTEEQRYGLGGVLPPDWPEINVSALDALESITGNGITLDDVADIVTAADKLRGAHRTKRVQRPQAA